MIVDAISNRARLSVSATGRAGRLAWRGLLRSRLLRWRYRGHPIEQLLLVPQDLRTGDPSFSSEIYHGHFGLAGTVALLGAQSPFEIQPPGKNWERALHGFGWLRHLRAANDEISREHARALVRDWIKMHGEPRGLAWEPEIIARRIISWLTHAAIFIEGSDELFYEEIMRSLSLQIRYLRSSYGDAPDGLPRLTTLAALAFAGLCADENYPSAFAREKVLSEEIKRQILPDGGHFSRNPGVLIELLLDFLPLRQCYIARNQTPVPELLGAIERMMPMLRFFRIGDQGFAHFNGMGPTPVEHLAALMVHDDVQGAPVSNAAWSGYCRLDAGLTALIAETGRTPPIGISGDAHAGCLSFEMSSNQRPVIVNCGVPAREEPEWRAVARATAAHSTLVVSDTSSAELVGGGTASLGPEERAKLSGPLNVHAELKNDHLSQELRASHDGYNSRYGITHIRTLRLSAAGNKLTGTDQLIAPGGLKGVAKDNGGEFAIRFHLHPTAHVELSSDMTSALICLSNDEDWRLISRKSPLAIEESVFLADVKGPRSAVQIVIHGSMNNAQDISVNWFLERVTVEHLVEDDESADDELSAEIFAEE